MNNPQTIADYYMAVSYTHLLEDTILGAEDRLTALEYELFRDVRKQISDNVSRIQKTARAIAVSYTHLDVYKRQMADKESIMAEKMFNGLVEGRVSKQLKEICLLDQTYVKACLLYTSRCV